MTLTEAAALFKKSVKILFIFVVGYYMWLFVIQPALGTAIRRILYKEEPPSVAYGMLDPLEFVEKPVPDITPRYVLNTKNGRLPSGIPNMMSVYKINPTPFSYLAGKNAVSNAEFLGFQPGDLISDLKGDIYKWRSIITGGTLEIKIETKELLLQTDIKGKENEFISGGINYDSAKIIASDMLKAIGRYDDPLYIKGEQTVRLGRVTQSGIVETIDSREAQVALVDFYRSIDKYKVLGPDPTRGLMRAIVRNPQRQNPALNYPYIEAYTWDINTNEKATYPIVTVSEAWNAVRSGKGVITSIVPKGSNPFLDYSPTRVESILIDNIYLAYFDTPKMQKIIQPIYVFQGKYTTKGTEGGDITLYFPAITKDYVKQIENK